MLGKALSLAAAGNAGGSNAWDISNAYYAGPLLGDVSTGRFVSSKVVATEENQPTGVFFKPDGTKMYVIGKGSGYVNEYALSTPWDVSSATYVQFFSVNVQDSGPEDIAFSSDGTKMYMLGSTLSDRVYEYSLSTAWDVSTASYVRFKAFDPQEAAVTGLYFKSDGTKMYLCGTSGQEVNEYTLSTPWDISTASHVQFFKVDSQDTSPSGVSFLGDGSKMYVLGITNESVYEYSLSTAWDISTASYTQSLQVSVTVGADEPRGMYMREDGSGFYTCESITDSVNQYTLGGYRVAPTQSTPNDIFFNPDGSQMFIIGLTGDNVSEFALSTAWDISTASFVQSVTVTGQEGSPHGLFFKPDGTKMYVTGISSDNVREYSLSTAWDISTYSLSNSFSVVTQDTQSSGLFFKDDGTKMYMSGYQNDKIYEYDLSTAWDVSTASFVQDLSVATQDTAPQAVAFDSSGTIMYVTGSQIDAVHVYLLSSAWNISTASFDQSFSVKPEGLLPTGLYWKNDGTQFWVVDSNIDRVCSYLIA